MYIKRHAEKTLERLSKMFSAVIVTGARQVGKSTMLENVYPSLEYVQLDSITAQAEALDNPEMFFVNHKPPIIVDEIQKVPTIFSYVKVIADKSRTKGQFYLTGSQNFNLMKGVRESLTGRAGILQLSGLSHRELLGIEHYEEFLPTKKHLETMKALRKVEFDFDRMAQHVLNGSFPELHSGEYTVGEKERNAYYDAYIKTYIEKDIRDQINIQDEVAFLKFLRAVAALTGELLNYTTLATMCGKDVKTAQKWLSVLITSGLVYLLEPFANNEGKRMIKTPKVYLLDTGLACYLSGWRTQEQLVNGARWGHLFETFIVGEIIKSYYNAGVSLLPIYYHRDKNNKDKEIDLVFDIGDTLYPVEIKTSAMPDKSMVANFGLLDAVRGNKKLGEGAVICTYKDPYFFNAENKVIPVDMI